MSDDGVRKSDRSIAGSGELPGGQYGLNRLRNIPRAPFISRSMIKPDSSLMVLDPPNFSSTLPSQLRVRLV